MFEIDMLAVESTTGTPSTKSGDAIAIRFTPDSGGDPKIVIIDGGFQDHGKDLVDHVIHYYGTRRVDLVISTHPDRDHIGGLIVVLDELDVDELLLHQPRNHFTNLADFSNLTAVDELIATAKNRGVRITSPFAGLQRFGGQLLVLGPTQDYYEQLVGEHLLEARAQQKAAIREDLSLANLLPRTALPPIVLPFLPIETLTDDVTTGPRNNTSVITLLRISGQHMLFTGDAGIPALEAAADRYEAVIGSFGTYPLSTLQVPHHGSRHNVGPSILDRILGPKDGRPFAATTAMISAAKAAPKHPSPRVTNALIRRGCTVVTTQGKSLCSYDGAAPRPWWVPATPLLAMDESGSGDE